MLMTVGSPPSSGPGRGPQSRPSAGDGVRDGVGSPAGARPTPRRKAAAIARRLAPLAILAAVAFVGWRMGALHHFTVEGFLERREALAAAVVDDYWQALGGFVLLYVVVVALSVPGALILTLSAGFLFGPVVGGAAAVAGATVGSTLLFLIARTAVGDLIRLRLGGRLAPFAEGFRRDAFNYLLFLRLAPVAPFWLVNLVPAFLGVSLRTFVAATAIGIVPATFAFATVGSGLDKVLAAQAEAKADCLAAGTCKLDLDVSALVTPHLLAALAALAVIALVPIAVRRFRRQEP